MPVQHFKQRWQFHQRINKKVWVNLERLKLIAKQQHSKQEILDALHPWRLDINLRFSNRFSILIIIVGISLILGAFIFYASSGGWLILSWLIGLGLCGYGYFSFEKQAEIDTVIQLLTNKVYQDQYQIKFHDFPQLVTTGGVVNSSYMLARVRQAFDCLNEGNAGNQIEFFASTSWCIADHAYPVLLFHYKCIDESVIRDAKNQNIKKQVVSHRYGACVFDMPQLAFMVSTTQKTYPRYPVKWSSSDIRFNQKFNIAGQQELELARHLSPKRILTLGDQLQHLKGSLMFHDEMNAFCYVSNQNIFASHPTKHPITDISMLRGYLRTLHAPHYETMKNSLMAIIQQFKDDDFINENKSNPKGG